MLPGLSGPNLIAVQPPVVSIDSKKFLFSAIYGYNDEIARRQLWSHLGSLASSYQNLPWLLAGDFNVIFHPTESSRYDRSQGFSADTKEFRECLHQLVVFYHISLGPLFTWSNKQHEGFIAKKLDRVLVNEEWLSTFSNSRVDFLPPGISDHCPAFIQLCHKEFSPPKLFKFFNFWANHPDFMRVVGQSWIQAIAGNPMEVLH
ncbi:hypothetical protein DITRI_Ditri01bG0049900 [Diplodiscus trichospermus]